MPIDISRLSKTDQRKPRIRALSLSVYQDKIDPTIFRVPGAQDIYIVTQWPYGLTCDCKASSHCAHMFAVEYYLKNNLKEETK